MVQIYPATLTQADFISGDVNVYAGKNIEIGAYKTSAQTINYFGKGSIENGVDNRGKLYISLFDTNATPVQLEGWVSLVIKDANRYTSKVIMRERTENLRASKTDITQAYMLGFVTPGAKQDSYLTIEFEPDADAVVSKDNSSMLIPITAYAGVQ